MHRNLAFILSALFLVTNSSAAEPPEFDAHVRPLLKKYCVGCHNAEEPEGKLVLESYEALLQGGEHGGVLTPGQGDASRLVRMLRGQAKPVMPPKDNPAPKAEEIAILAAWINAGAKGPTGAAPDPKLLITPRVAVAQAHPKRIPAVAVSPNGQWLAIARYGAVEVYSLPGKKLLRDITGLRGQVNGLAFASDSSLLAAAAGEAGLFGEVRVFRTGDWQQDKLLEAGSDAFYTVAVSPRGETLAAGGYDGRVFLFDRKSGAVKHAIAGHNGAVFDVAFHPGGEILASASGDRTVKLWNVANAARLDTFGESLKDLYTLAFHPQGTHLAAGGVDNRIRVWRISPSGKEGTNKLVQSRFAHDAAILRLVWSARGDMLVSSAEDRTVKVWEASTIQFRATLPQPDWTPALALHPTQANLYVGRLNGTWEELSLQGVAAAEHSSAQPLAEVPPEIDYGAQPEVAALPKSPEREPNHEPAQATSLPIPGVATGRLFAEAGQTTDRADLFRFEAKQGEQWILETNAARSGSPLDSRIEVLSAEGRPILALQLQAVRNSEIEFRGIDSNQRGLRAANWEETLLNEYIYLSGEVIKLHRQRQGPDSDGQFYPHEGNRHTFFHSTPRAHALGEPAYVVAPYAAGAKLAENGLPVFPVYFENDDDGRRLLGSDSFLHFTAPADGAYLVRVSDTRGFLGDNFKYELVVRRPRPDFSVTLETAKLSLSAGSGREFKVKVARHDNYHGAVHVHIAGLPPGFLASSPLVIEAGHFQAEGVLHASPGTASLSAEMLAKVQVTATAHVFGQPVTKPVKGFAEVQVTDRPKVIAHLELEGSPVPPPTVDRAWKPLASTSATSSAGATLTPQADLSLLASGTHADTDVYTITLETDIRPLKSLRLEVLGDKSLPAGAPGRAEGNGNFVLSEFKAVAAPKSDPAKSKPLVFASAAADYAQPSWDVKGLIDGKPETGWAIADHSDGKTFPVKRNGNDPSHHATLVFQEPLDFGEPAVLTITLEQTSKVKQHALGRFRISAAVDPPAPPVVLPEPPEITITAGGSTTCRLRVERHGFNDRISFDVNNLPHGVIVDNIGLNGVLLTEQDSQRTLYFTAEPWVGETERLFHAVAKVEGNQVSLPMRLRVLAK